jgi:hypothetical protein
MTKRSLILGLLCVCGLAFGDVSAQQLSPPADTGMSCADSLELPDYPGIAQRARFATRLTSIIALSPGGSVQTISFEPATGAGPSLFKGEVERALRASTFASACGGRSVTVAFEFRLADVSPETRRTVAFQYPNRFIISAGGTVIDF